MPPPPIMEFTDSHRFLSNFYSTSACWNGKSYRTSEHAFQAAKTHDLLKRQAIHAASTAAEAKKLGRKLPLREDWEEVKDQVMLSIIRNKFDVAARPKMAIKLIQTHPRELYEGNTWGDTYWGVDLGSLKGLNKLGFILMQVRDEIRPAIPAITTKVH